MPGRGSIVGRTRTGEPVGVLNLMGRVFMTPLDDPFALALREVESLRAKARVIFVDFHAEATSEKIAMGWHLDGLVTAVVGTHTHVQTADERILPKGTACLTDAGMTGPHDSIIGVTVEAALGRFVNAMPTKFEAASGAGRLNAVIVTADPKTGPRDGHRAPQSVGRSRSRRSRRPRPPPRTADRSARARAGADLMSDLFSQPFEDDRQTRRRRRERRVVTVSQLTARFAGSSNPDSAMSGSRARSRTARSGTPATCTSRSRMAARRSKR